MADEVFLKLEGIKKSFGGVHALKGVDLEIRKGEIHCLAGENGCGKSTLIKAISGVHNADEGSIWIDGEKVEKMKPMDAINRGIQVIYQDFAVFPNLTVAENIALNGELKNKIKFVNWKQIHETAFLSPATAINLARAGIFTMCFAICEMVVIISGGIDVSFPAVGCVAMYVPLYMNYHEMGPDNLFFFFGLAMFIGLVFGILNGILVSYLKLPPLIATLATSSVASGGLVMLLGTREFTTLPSSLQSLYEINMITYTAPSTGFTYPLTVLFLVPVILCVVMALVMKFTMLGRGLYAIGGDANAARIAGFNVRRLQFFAYIFCGVVAGATAMIYTTLMHSSTTSALMGDEMIIIAACVVGGCRLTGGHGSVGGTVLGVLLITLVQNNLNMLGIPTCWQTFAVGLVLLLGAIMTSIQAKRQASLGKI